MQSILKSWKTSLIGLILLAYLVYKLFWQGHEIDTATLLQMLMALGFLASKDGTDSHTKRDNGPEWPS